MNSVVLASEEIIRRATLRRIPVTVRALPVRCWNCGNGDAAVAFVHLDGVTNGGEVVATTRTLTLSYAAELLTDAEHPQAKSIKVRNNRVTGASYLSNGCLHCDALFGGKTLDDGLYQSLARGEVDSLPVLVTVQRSGVEWFSLLGLSWTTGRLG